jgi:hypothetical protein
MNGLLTQTPLPAGTYECATLIERRDDRLVLGPDTPDTIPGNMQYTFLLRLPSGEPHRIEIVWPHHETNLRPGFDYPHNANFGDVLERVLFLRRDGEGWQRLTDAVARPHGAEVLIPAQDRPAWLSVGIPWFACDHDALIDFARGDDRWRVEEIGNSAEGIPLHGCFRPASPSGKTKGLFMLSAYQHYSEWAGPHALDEFIRNPPAGSDAFDWAVIPCVNMDALHRGWRGNLQHQPEPPDAEHNGNLNRAWNPPCLPETRAAASFFQRSADISPPLHALDLHMGWSTPDRGGDGLTVYHPGELPESLDQHIRRFTDAFFQHVPIEPFAWQNGRLQAASAATWFTREWGIPGQTLEISRFRAFKADGAHAPVSEAYYRSIGTATAETLIAYYSSGNTTQ